MAKRPKPAKGKPKGPKGRPSKGGGATGGHTALRT